MTKETSIPVYSESLVAELRSAFAALFEREVDVRLGQALTRLMMQGRSEEALAALKALM